jgi:hypothetical protein
MDVNDCHLKLGHGGSFKAYNPKVEEHAKQARGGKSPRSFVEALAKANRLFKDVGVK